MTEGTYKWKCLVGFMDGRAGSCLFNFCYELCWNLDGDCIVFVDGFFLDGRFYHINPTDQWWWEVFLSSDIFFSFYLQCFKIFIIQGLLLLDQNYPRILFETIVKGVAFLISFSAHLSFVCMRGSACCELILYEATLPEVFIDSRNSLLDF